jgi:uncharacterized protein (TIGR02117 family)
MKWRRLVLIALAPVAAYLAAAFAGSHIPVNPDWQQGEPDLGVTIHITDNGWHTGLILPVRAAGINLSRHFPADDLPDPEKAGQWLIFGWGDRTFYLETPTWSDLRPSTAIAAVAGSGETLLHVDHVDLPDEAYAPRPIRLSEAEYRKLATALIHTAQPNFEPIKGYGARDIFYPAKGRYSLIRTCNVWTRDLLAGAGVKIGWWTPFSGGVMRWFPAPPKG